MFINMAAGAVGAIILIAIIIPWFLIAVAVCAVLYALASAYYRASAVEIKVRFRLSYTTSPLQLTDGRFDSDWVSSHTVSSFSLCARH